MLRIFFAKIVANLKKYLKLRSSKKVHYLGVCLLSLTLIASFQNCQQSPNHFTASKSSQVSSVSSSSTPVINITSELVNSANCTEGLRVTISSDNHSLADEPYSFDGGNTWNASSSKIFKESATLVVGQIMVKDQNGAISINTNPFKIDLDKCNLNTDVNTGPVVEGTGVWTSSTSCSGTTQVISYSCIGGDGKCSGAQPASSSTNNSLACGYVAPPTGSWVASTSCNGTTQMLSYSCIGGNGQCSGNQPSSISTPNSAVCSVPGTGTWTSSVSCIGTTQNTSYSCTGGNGQCSGAQPSGASAFNSPACGYVAAPTGNWTSSTSCNGTTQIISYTCIGGNGQCSGSQPTGSAVPNSIACGYVAPSCSNGLNISQYPNCSCPSGQSQSGNTCIVNQSYSLQVTNTTDLKNRIADPILQAGLGSFKSNSIPVVIKNTGNSSCTPSVTVNQASLVKNAYLDMYFTSDADISITSDTPNIQLSSGATATYIFFVSARHNSHDSGWTINSYSSLVPSFESLGTAYFKCGEDTTGSVLTGVSFNNGIYLQ
ncbi:MAG: hypothetical protein ACXVCY_16295 [Pseudobdellovibrionaceae bacterium]